LLKRLPSVALLLAWLSANGALLDVVQVLAWGRMFAGYAETMEVRAALARTFDPYRPCHLCRNIAKAREQAKSQIPAVAERAAKKLILALHQAAPVILSPVTETWAPPAPAEGPSRSDPVPVPPPRQLS
jgi:hypothetical protein